MQKRIIVLLGAAFIALFAVSLVIGASDAERITALEERLTELRERVEAGKADGSIQTVVFEKPNPELIGEIGVPLTTEDGELTLVSVSYNAAGELELSLKLENTTDEDQAVYGIDFSVLDGDGWVQNDSNTPDDVRFSGDVEKGGTKEGILRFKVNGRLPFRVYYAENVYDDKLYVWEIMEVEGLDIAQGPIPGTDEARIADLEAEISALWLEAAGTEPVVDPTIIHSMNEAVPTSIGQLQLTRAFVRTDQVVELSFKLVNTTGQVSSMDDYKVIVRDGNGERLSRYYDCENVLGANILPGDMAQGKACFDDFTLPPLRVYYLVDTSEAEIVTWEIK